jgi:hypothetical protein
LIQEGDERCRSGSPKTPALGKNGPLKKRPYEKTKEA